MMMVKPATFVMKMKADPARSDHCRDYETENFVFDASLCKGEAQFEYLHFV